MKFFAILLLIGVIAAMTVEAKDKKPYRPRPGPRRGRSILLSRAADGGARVYKNPDGGYGVEAKQDVYTNDNVNVYVKSQVHHQPGQGTGHGGEIGVNWG